MASDRMKPSAAPAPMAGFPLMTRFRAQLQARLQWEAENPDMAKAWNEAWLEDETRNREIEAEESRKRFVANMPERLQRMGVPALVIDALRAQIRTPAMEHVMAFNGSSKSILLLLGGPGTGKTVAAASSLIEAPTHSSVYAQAIDVARLSDFNVEHAHELDRVTEARLLVLDDLGAEHANDFWISRLDGIVNRRYAGKLRTIITSNLDAARFKKQYGERIADRIRQVGMVKSCGNVSMRKGSL